MKKCIKVILTDVDGVLTDGSINISPNGELYKSFNVKDGYIVKKAMEKGLIIGIITGRESDIVKYRCQELGIEEVFQGVKNKINVCKKIAQKYNVEFANIAYIGDDYPDLDLLKIVGYSGAPSDAIEEIKSTVDFISKYKGGKGAYREFVETILSNHL